MSFGLKETERLHAQIRGAQIAARAAASEPGTPPDTSRRLKQLAQSLDASVWHASELLDEAVRRP